MLLGLALGRGKGWAVLRTFGNTGPLCDLETQLMDASCSFSNLERAGMETQKGEHLRSWKAEFLTIATSQRGEHLCAH